MRALLERAIEIIARVAKKMNIPSAAAVS